MSTEFKLGLLIGTSLPIKIKLHIVIACCQDLVCVKELTGTGELTVKTAAFQKQN